MAVRWRVVLPATGVLFVLIVAAAAYVFRSTGRTPESNFVRDAFGSEAVLFDETYPGTGSSENRSRTIVLRTPQEPDEVLATIAANGGWRRLGDGLERESDGLCVVPFSAKDYLSTARPRDEELRTVTEREQPTVVLSLLYC